MNLSNIKKIADILAAAGVLISLLYLGIQVADNNKFLRSQAHYNALELNINPMVAVISDDELAELLVSCDRGLADLTEGQIRQCDFYYFVLFNTWEYIYYQNIDEALPEAFWEGADAYYSNELENTQGFRIFWEKYESAFAKPFKSHVLRFSIFDYFVKV